MRVSVAGLFIAVLLQSVPLSAAESLGMHETEPWIVAADNPVGPGVLIELSALLFAGQPIEQQRMPVRRLLLEAQSGRFDWVFLACHLSLPQHEALNRIFAFDLGVLVRSASTVQGLPDLQGQSVAVWTTHLGNLPQLEQDPGIAKVEINSFQNGVQMLQEQRVAALAGSNYALSWALAQAGADSSQFRFVPVLAREGCLFANKALPAERRERIRKDMAALVANGTVQKLLQRYSGNKLPR